MAVVLILGDRLSVRSVGEKGVQIRRMQSGATSQRAIKSIMYVILALS